QGHRHRPGHARAGDRERQRRGRQVVADREPRSGALRQGPPRGRPGRRHLRPFDPAPARRLAAPGRRRQDDRPARRTRREADVDRLLPGRERTRDVARPDAAPRARAVPDRRPLGRARRPARRHAPRHRRRLDLARPAPPQSRGCDRHDAATAGTGGGCPRCADGAEDEHARDRRGREHDLPGLRLGRWRRAGERCRRHAAPPGPLRPRARGSGGPGRAARLVRSRRRGRAGDCRRRRGPRRRQEDVQAAAGSLVLNEDEVKPRLAALGFSDADAQTLADHFIDAEQRGKYGHGFSRVEWLGTLDGLDPTATPELVTSEPGYERWHGCGAVGYLTLAAVCAAQLETPPERTRIVVCESTFPTGGLGYWVRKLAEGGLCAALTATSPPRLAHPEGGEPLVGTTRLAIGIPSSDGKPLVTDVSMGKVTHCVVIAGLAEGSDLVP